MSLKQSSVIVQRNRQKLMMVTQHTGTLAGSPSLSRADAPTKHTTLCKWTGGAQNSGTFEMHSGKNSTNLFCILSTNTWTKGFHSFCWFCIFFSLSFGSRSPLIPNSLCKNIKKDNPLDLIDTKPSARPPPLPLSSAYGPHFF